MDTPQDNIYQITFERAPVGIAHLDAAGRWLQVNPCLCNWLGYTRDELLTMSFGDVAYPADYPKAAAAYEQLVRGDADDRSLEKRYVRKDGSYFWVHASLSAVRDKAGAFRFAIGIVEDITEQKITQEIFVERERFVEKVTYNVPDIIYVYSLVEDRNVWTNSTVVQVLGYTPEEVRGMGSQMPFMLIHPDDLAKMGDRASHFVGLENDAVVEVEYRMRHADGTWRWLYSRDTVFSRNDDGSPQEIIGVAQDITERKRQEEALRESEGRLQALVANLPGSAVFVIDRDMRYQLAEGEALQPAGFQPESLVGKSIFEALDPALAKGYEPLFHGALAGNPFSYEHQSHGRSFISRGVPLRNGRGEVTAVLAISYDITERKQAEAALRESEERYHTLFTSISEGFSLCEIILDESGQPVDYRFLAINPAFTEITGYPPDAIGRTARQLLPGIEEDWIRTVGRVALERQSIETETYIPGLDRWFNVSAVPVGEPERRQFAGIFADITERKRREAHQNLLIEIGDDLSRLVTPDEIMQAVGARLGEYLNLGICVFVDVDEERGEVTVHHGWNREGVTSLEKQTFRMSDYATEEFQRASRAGELFIIRDTATDERVDGDAYARLNVGAWLSVPFHRAGRWTAYLSVTDTAPRDWRDDEIELVRTIADRVFPRIERARAEDALRESEARLRRAFEIETVGVIFFTTDGDITEANDAFLHMAGFTQEDLHNGLLRWDALTPSEWMPSSEHAIEEFKATGRTTPYEKEYYRKDGSRWWALFAATRLTEMEGVEFIINISESKRAEEALRASEEKYRRLFTAMAQGFCIIEKVETAPSQPSDFRYLMVNPAFERLTGIHHVVGKTLREFVPNIEQSLVDRYDSVIRTGQPQHFEDYVSALDLWIEAEAVSTGIPGQIAVLFTNVSERRRAEEMLRRAAALDAYRIKLADALRPLNDPGDIQTVASRVLGEWLDVDRAYYATFEPDGDGEQIIIPPGHFLKPGVLDIAGRYPAAVFGGEVIETLRANRPFATEDNQTDARFTERERSAYAAIAVHGYIVVPLHKAGQLVAVIAVTQASPRVWTEEEIELVAETGERTWAAVERGRAEAEREQLRIAVAREQALFQAVAQQYPTPIIIAEAPSGLVIFTNDHVTDLYMGAKIANTTSVADYDEWEFFRRDGEMYHADETPLARSLLQGEVVLEENMEVERLDGSRAILFVTSTPIRDQSGAIIAAVLIANDITERDRAATVEREQVRAFAVVEERQRLARDMHDAVTQTLFSANIIAESLPLLKMRSPDQVEEQTEQLQRLTRGALAEMRMLLLELRPENLPNIDLRTQIHQLVDALRARKRLEIALTIEDGHPIPPEVRVAFYRITQEALNNIVKHARATHVEVDFQSTDHEVRIQVKDDGVGFALEGKTSPTAAALPQYESQQTYADQFGLQNMRERAASIGASLTLISAPGAGTSVVLVWQRGQRK